MTAAGGRLPAVGSTERRQRHRADRGDGAVPERPRMAAAVGVALAAGSVRRRGGVVPFSDIVGRQRERQLGVLDVALLEQQCGVDRSEEHTSELQSLMRISYAVFCLKKKT